MIVKNIQVWRVADVPADDKFGYTYFAHKLNSFETAPKRFLASDSRIRPDRYALEKGDLSKAGAEKSRFFHRLFVSLSLCLSLSLFLSPLPLTHPPTQMQVNFNTPNRSQEHSLF